MYSFLPDSTAVPDESQAVLIAQIEESRTLRSEQDEEYKAALWANQQKEIRNRAFESIEERRRMVIEKRCQRIVHREEPKDGISLKSKYPDGSVKIGRFKESEPIQVLFDFAGQTEAATELFKLQEAACGTAIESTSSGIISPVEWISNQMDTNQQQIAMGSAELLWNPHGPPASSPTSNMAEEPSQTSPLAHTPILIDDDDDVSEGPFCIDLQTPETPFSPFPQGEALKDIGDKYVARMFPVCVVHGGVGPHFFQRGYTSRFVGYQQLRSDWKMLVKIPEAKTVEEAYIAIEEAADSLNIIGSLRYVTKMEEKASVVRSAVEFLMNGRMRDANDQFVKGLKTFGLFEELQKNPSGFHDLSGGW